ncbi:MAG TPA: putative maltokinase [Chloroflexia bacterium]|jgi:maltose alpha-D-glucosyltransferase/alpha-amylase
MSQSSKLDISNSWEEIFAGENKAALEAILPAYLLSCRWFGGKARTIRSAEIAEAFPFSHGAFITTIQVRYAEGEPQTYVLPLTFASGERSAKVQRDTPQAVVAQLPGSVLYDAVYDKGFASSLLEAIREDSQFKSSSGEIRAWPTTEFQELAEPSQSPLEPRIMRAEQSNTSVMYGGSFILKLFRRLEEGTSPDLEIGRFLTEKGYSHTPPLAGAVEYYPHTGEPLTLAILQGFVPNQGDAWQYTLDALGDYFTRATEMRLDGREISPRNQHLLNIISEDIPPHIRQATGPFMEAVGLLGRRTAEMHIALASDPDDPAFAPEPFTEGYQASIYEAMRGLTGQAMSLLRNRMDSLPDATEREARNTLEREGDVLARFQPLVEHRLNAMRTRCHGDYHLGQVLYTGSDFAIIDFEGEPVRSLAERRRKHSPLKDVAGMLRSFHYAAYAALFSELEKGADAQRHEPLASAWYLWVSAAFLREYLAVARQGSFLPADEEDLLVLLDAHILEKAVYELIYELNNRPDWVRIPLQALRG